jgi:hypothetical protein
MRRQTWVLALVAGVALWACAARAGAGEPFFNGKDLSGWVGLDGYWSVKDGALVGATPKGLAFNTFLCSKKKYVNFELKFEVRLSSGSANSGVQIRSAVFDLERYAVMGPQCDMGGIFWGSLYGEHYPPNAKANTGMIKAAPKDVVDKVLKKDSFNEYHILAVGRRITIKLNGATTVDDEFPMIPDEGLIAFQLHSGPAMEVVFRNIQFKELPRGGKKKETPKQAVSPVTGKVLYAGKPLADAKITLHPEEKGPTATGITFADGTFALTTYKENDGAPAGRYRVTVTAERDGKNLLPARFANPETTDLVFEVRGGVKNEITINLAK